MTLLLYSDFMSLTSFIFDKLRKNADRNRRLMPAIHRVGYITYESKFSQLMPMPNANVNDVAIPMTMLININRITKRYLRDTASLLFIYKPIYFPSSSSRRYTMRSRLEPRNHCFSYTLCCCFSTQIRRTNFFC